MGVYHQGGVLEGQLAVRKAISETLMSCHAREGGNTGSDRTRIQSTFTAATVFWWKTYPPPLYLLGKGANSHSLDQPVNITTISLMGRPFSDVQSTLDSAVGPCFSGNPDIDKKLRNVQAAKVVFIALPFSSLPPKYNPGIIDRRWLPVDEEHWSLRKAHQIEGAEIRASLVASFSRHLNLDDIDFEEDGVGGTIARVIGKRGLGLWRLERLCIQDLQHRETLLTKDQDLTQQKFTIDAEPSETILQVKEKLAKEKGWDVQQQKLIFSGKILKNEDTVESCNIEEKGFIPKAPPASASKPPSTPSSNQTTATPAPPAAPQAAPATTANAPSTPSPAPATGNASDPARFNDPSALLVGNQGDSVVTQMEAMGFQRSEIDRAMRAAFFNPDRAIEYLLNGIPENVQSDQRQASSRGGTQGSPAPGAQATPGSNAPATPNPPAAATETDEPVNLFEAAAQAGGGNRGGAGTGARAGGGGAGTSPLGGTGAGGAGGQMSMEFLRNNPAFQNLRQIVQQQPAMLEPILQQVAEGNPQLAQMIGQNQEQFLQLLSEDVEGEGGEGGQLPPGAVPVSVTEEERDAIERLCRLGFSRDAVIQAYFACDKNEELAANFLFEQPEDD
ncbi:MAG: hypothetical protein Q9160_008624 [Pyrenula sp. 1 TL-2023]